MIRSRAQNRAQLREIGLERHDKGRLRRCPRRFVGLRQFHCIGGEAPRCIGAGALGIAGNLVELLGQPVKRRDIFSIGRRLARCGLLQHRAHVVG